MSETIAACAITFILAVVGTFAVSLTGIDRMDKARVSAGYMILDGKAYKITPVQP